MSTTGTPEPTKKVKRGGVAAALAGSNIGKPEDQGTPGGGVGPASPPPGTTPEAPTPGAPEELSDDQRAEQERLAREEQERLDAQERERQKPPAPAPPVPAPEPEPVTPQAAAEPEARRGRGRKKMEGRDVRHGRSFRATDEEYNVIYDTLDLLFQRANAVERRKIEASAVIRAALRIAKAEPDRVLDEIREHNDFNP